MIGVQLAPTVTLITLVLVTFRLATSLALSVAHLAALIPAHQDSFTTLTNDLRAWLGSIGQCPDLLHAALNEINFANISALRRPMTARSVAFSRRSSSSLGALVGRQVVLDVEDVDGCVPAAVCLGHLRPPERRWRFRLPPAEASGVTRIG